eukprot:TRINITY_DN87_c0_g1_i8.p1 TRINITY_DN87_c0_g1~~TRINITY_DN87_c0_g1_i8.p1  ORF type:complete len:269 (-),score=132.37 TRINITY_DN87_c0_g1_i8:166-972(-)
MTLDVSSSHRNSRKPKRSSTPKPTLWSVYDPKNPKPLRAEKVKKSQDKWHTFNPSDFTASSATTTTSSATTTSYYSSSSSSASSANVQTGYSMYSAQSTTSVAVVTSPIYLSRPETTTTGSQASPMTTELQSFVPAMSHTSSSSLSSSSSPSPRHNSSYNVAPRRDSFSPFDVYQSDLLTDSIFGPYGLGFDLLGPDQLVSEIPPSEPHPQQQQPSSSSSSSSSPSSSFLPHVSLFDAFPKPSRSSSLFTALCPSSESTFYTEFAPLA